MQRDNRAHADRKLSSYVARTTPVKKAWRSLAWLAAIIAALAGLNLYGVLVDGGGWAPKLDLDLAGGTQIILTPQLETGQTVSQDELNQAVAIIRQRVDASGVSEAQINTQGSKNIVVSLPGTPDQATLDRIQSSAKLEFRAVICATDAAQATAACTPTSPTATPTPSATPGDPSTAAPADGSDTSTDTPTPTPSATAGADGSKINGSLDSWITPDVLERYSTLDCTKLDEAGTNVAPAAQPLVTCQNDGTVKYILGPVEVTGETISDASSGTVTTQQGASTGTWAVNLVFNAQGTTEFADVTTRLLTFRAATDGTDVKNRFAIVLDGNVIEAPGTNDAITNGKAQITGNFTQATAKTLADQLKFGALPIGFKVESQNSITATLGKAQLLSGLLAGLIGLILVVLYSLLQYRALAAVTISSLVIAAAIVYLLVTFLSWREGLRLSLAGVAGLIVSIGITADSFIVYFERIRDELRDGRGLESAVEAGWRRAIRTVLASDAVNFLAAATLFLLAVGNVRGFALTLGLTTIVDVVVVSLFTHPVLQLLARTRFFGGGHPLSGLDPQALGAVYRGRAQFKARVVTTGKSAASEKEAVRRQTIAERKAAEAAPAPRTKGKDS